MPPGIVIPRSLQVIFKFGKKKQAEILEEAEVELIRFQGALNGVPPEMEANAKLVKIALEPLKELFTDAVTRRADTIRIEPKGDRATIAFLIDGVAIPAGRVPKQRAHAMTQMTKVLCGLDISERTQPQSGGVKASVGEDEFELKTMTTPVAGGMERLLVYIRNLDEKLEKPEHIGMPSELKLAIRNLTSGRKKLFLVCGPSRTGITTTLYASVRGLDAYLHVIFTIGDTEGRSLLNISTFDTDPTHDLQETLRRCIRVEAEVILLDPIRNAEDARVVAGFYDDAVMISEITAADAATGILQMAEWLGDGALAAKVLSGVLSQKLIRKLCNDCKEAFKPSPKLMKKIGLKADEITVLYRKASPPVEPLPKGEEWEPCTTCDDTGYFGRTTIFELIEMSEGMQGLLAGGADATALREQARTEKMRTLKNDAMRLVADGTTSLEELQRAFKGN
jgi:type IV pilus assembly protein PilB